MKSIALPLFSLLGIGVAGIGLWLHRRTRAFLRRARQVTGRYVGAAVERTLTDVSQSTSYATIEIRTESGQTVQFSSRVGTPFAARKMGRQVQVLYDPSCPEEAVVNSFIELWLPSLIFLSTGVGLALAPIILWLVLGPAR